MDDEELQSASDTPESSGHIPVLPAQVVQCLDPRPGRVILDCTLGRAGHAGLIVPKLSPGGQYIGLDVDPINVEFSRAVLAAPEVSKGVRVDVVNSNFARARAALDGLGVDRVDLVLADLGFASNQMSDPGRGFSFTRDGPLDMRLDPALALTAAELVNSLPERELADLIYRYGEDRLSRKIARKIVEERERSPILTTGDLSRVVRRAYGSLGAPGRSRIDPSTRTFMALRIAVNDELAALERLLGGLPQLVTTGGRVAIISFHSLEDRLVKHAFAAYEREEKASRLTRKPMVADDAERNANPRSRSAKLRAIEWTV